MADPIKVLIIDDSALIRRFLSDVINAQPDMKVVDTAADPVFARDKIKRHMPDVITLDIEMPRMDGITFLKKLMAAMPLPVVMFSSHTRAGAEATVQALSAGAVDFVAKPLSNLSQKLPQLSEEIVEKVRTAAKAKVRRTRPSLADMQVPKRIEVEEFVSIGKARPRTGGPMVALLGASTGGTVALEQVLCGLPVDCPPIAIVQHMPEHFTLAFANRLNGLAQIQIAEGEDMAPLRPGTALIAPGGKHMLLEMRGGGYHVRVKDGPPVNRHRPSVDVLFRSGVNAAGANAVAAIMTGMGDDGAKGMRDLHDAGAFTIAQNEDTCTVYGMPKAAVALGGVDRVAPLEKIAPMILGLWKQPHGKAV